MPSLYLPSAEMMPVYLAVIVLCILAMYAADHDWPDDG